MKDITRKRLEWLVIAKAGTPFPDQLFETETNSWADSLAETAKEVLTDLDSYRGIKVETSLVSGDQIVWIDGIKYARELFQAFAETPLNECFRIVTRDAGLLQIERLPTWRPIATAPVQPWTPELPSYYQFRCLLQIPGTKAPSVIEGEGYWVVPTTRYKNRTPQLRWKAQYLGVVYPSHWQPLPLPFNEPLNEETTHGH